MRASPVLAVERAPSPRPQALHHSLLAGAPLPLRLVSITKGTFPPRRSDTFLPKVVVSSVAAV